MTKPARKPAIAHAAPSPGIAPGSRIRVTAGPYAGQTGVVTDVFIRSSGAPSRVLVRGLASSPYVVASVMMDCVEVVGRGEW